MTTVCYTRCYSPDATCPFCTGQTEVRAEWFFYRNAHTMNAIAICNDHALAQIGTLWALGDTILIGGVQYDPPEPFGVIHAARGGREGAGNA